MVEHLCKNFSYKIQKFDEVCSFYEEQNQNVGLKKIDLLYPILYKIDTTLYKEWQFILEKMGVFKCKDNPQNWFEDLDCDLITLLEKDNTTYVVLTELKSRFDTSDILHAYKQLYFSFLKMHIALSFSKNYSYKNCKVIAIIALLPPDNEKSVITSIKDKIRKYEMNGKNVSFDIKFAVKIYESQNKRIAIKLGEIPFKKNMELSDELNNIDFNIQLYLADKIDAENISINLDDII